MTAGEASEEEILRGRIATIVEDWDGVEQVTMFGCPSFTARDDLFCVVSDQGLSLTRFPPDERESLEDLAPVSPFDANGRSVERWATVESTDLPEDVILARFVRASYDAALEAAGQ